MAFGMALLLVVAGCAGEGASGDDYEYVPQGGQGCGFSAYEDVEESTSDHVDVEPVEENKVF